MSDFISSAFLQIQQLIGACALDDLTWLQQREILKPDEHERLESEKKDISLELYNFPSCFAAWMSCERSENSLMVERLYESAIHSLGLVKQKMEYNLFDALVESLARVRPFIVQIQRESAMPAAHQGRRQISPSGASKPEPPHQ